VGWIEILSTHTARLLTGFLAHLSEDRLDMPEYAAVGRADAEIARKRAEAKKQQRMMRRIKKLTKPKPTKK